MSLPTSFTEALPDKIAVLVVGDEVESCLTAVSAARVLGNQGQVALWRADDGLLGGLCTRAQLSYMDITPEWVPPLFGEFIDQAGVERVALERHSAHCVLETMLTEAGVATFTGGSIDNAVYDSGQWQLTNASRQTMTAAIVIDATPDADVCRLLNHPHTVGLGGLLIDENANLPWPNTLGISPVFHTTGVSSEALIAFEAQLRAHPETPALIAAGLPWLTEHEQADLLTRPIYAEQDYVDVLNPVIGLWFHRWQGYTAETYATATVKVDGFNISRLPNGVLGWNGLVATLDDVEQQIAFSQGHANWPTELTQALSAFGTFLRTEGNISEAVVIPPERLYIRQTVNLQTPHTIDATELFQGGVSADEAIGTFSYWIDLRGVSVRQRWSDITTNLPKPTFNVGLHQAKTAFPNLACVSRAGGYGPLTQGVCRIVQHLAQLGEGVGIAAALATQQHGLLENVPVVDVKTILNQRYHDTQQRELPTEGRITLSLNDCFVHPAIQREQTLLNAYQA